MIVRHIIVVCSAFVWAGQVDSQTIQIQLSQDNDLIGFSKIGSDFYTWQLNMDATSFKILDHRKRFTLLIPGSNSEIAAWQELSGFITRDFVDGTSLEYSYGPLSQGVLPRIERFVNFAGIVGHGRFVFGEVYESREWRIGPFGKLTGKALFTLVDIRSGKNVSSISAPMNRLSSVPPIILNLNRDSFLLASPSHLPSGNGSFLSMFTIEPFARTSEIHIKGKILDLVQTENSIILRHRDLNRNGILKVAIGEDGFGEIQSLASHPANRPMADAISMFEEIQSIMSENSVDFSREILRTHLTDIKFRGKASGTILASIKKRTTVFRGLMYKLLLVRSESEEQPVYQSIEIDKLILDVGTQ